MSNVQINPFDGELAIANSNYCRFANGLLIHAGETGGEPSKATQFVHHQLRDMFLAPEFSCPGARAAINNGTYRFSLYKSLGSPESTEGLCRDLHFFVGEQDAMKSNYTTFAACFMGPHPSSQEHFRDMLWEQLQLLHDRDAEFHCYDTTVSNDPMDPRFAFSFAGRAFFIAGMNPASQRMIRKFAYPTLVFNARRQFQHLTDTGKMPHFQSVVRGNEIELQGTLNPNLDPFGNVPEPPQYAGVPKNEQIPWKCPFHPHQIADEGE